MTVANPVVEKDTRTVLDVEVKVIQREVKNGAEKGKKFMAYKIFNKKRGYYEELRFNSKVKNMPVEEGTFIVTVGKEEINRIDTTSRKYPLTWISKIDSVESYANATFDPSDEDLPF